MVKERLAVSLSWWAFIHSAVVITLPAYLLFSSKDGMFEGEPGFYSAALSRYSELLDAFPGGVEIWFFALPPVIWVILRITMGSPRLLPWRR